MAVIVRLFAKMVKLSKKIEKGLLGTGKDLLGTQDGTMDRGRRLLQDKISEINLTCCRKYKKETRKIIMADKSAEISSRCRKCCPPKFCPIGYRDCLTQTVNHLPRCCTSYPASSNVFRSRVPFGSIFCHHT